MPISGSHVPSQLAGCLFKKSRNQFSRTRSRTARRIGSLQFSSFHFNPTRRLLSSSPFAAMETAQPAAKKDDYSVWALPPDHVVARLKKLMDGLRSEFGGPQFEPHVTIVGAIRLTEDEAIAKLKAACDGLKGYTATIEHVATGTFFYQCVFLLLHPTSEVVETSEHCCRHFGHERSSPYMPHLSILYGDLADEEKKKAQDKANLLDASLSGLSFPINRLALYKTDTEDKTLESWEKIAEYCLMPN